jgi:CHAT domain-containing protein/Tfp pilus assembly protein PilF
MKRFALAVVFFHLIAGLPCLFAQDINVANQVQLLYENGLALRSEGNLEKSAKAFSQALETIQGNFDSQRHFKTDILINLGILSWDLGATRESYEYFVRAEASAEKYGVKEKIEYCRSVIKLTILYFRAKDLRDSEGDYTGSEKAFRDAIAIAKKIHSDDHQIKCLRQLSINYQENNNIGEFSRLNMEARELAQQSHIEREFGYCSYNIGLYYLKVNLYSLALENFEVALKAAQKLGDKFDEADCLMALGNTYGEIGQYDKALDYLNPALEIHKSQKNRERITKDLLNMGVMFRRRGYISGNRQDLQKALQHYQEALVLSRTLGIQSDELMILNNIGSVYFDLSDYSKAMHYFKEGLDKANKTSYVETRGLILNNIGIVQAAMGNYEESTEYYQQAIDLALEIHGGQILWEAYLEMANAYKKQGKFNLALENYKHSIAVIEDIRSKLSLEELKASFLGTSKRLEPYQQLIDLCVRMDQAQPDQGFILQAFNYLEMAKARAFLDSLEVADIDFSQNVDFKLRNREKEISGDLSRLYSALAVQELPETRRREIIDKIRGLETDYESLKRDIRLKSPVYADLRYPEIISLADTQRTLLDSKTAIWAYSVGKDRSYVFVITRKSVQVGVLPPRGELQDKITEYLRAISDKENKDFHSGRELGRLLMPVSLEPGITSIIIVPDDWLNFMPFEALPGGPGGPAWLVQKYRISYIPSISSYRELRLREKTRPGRVNMDLLAVGNPLPGPQGAHKLSLESLSGGGGDSEPEQTDSLKFSGREIRAISSLFKAAKVRTETGAKATEQELKSLPLNDFRILHFATHATIDDKNPARSYLLLSPSPAQEDGFLQTREIFNLKISADLVTLSACQTGLGQLVRGEGLEGLSRAFFYAGASAVLMSLWSIDDQASSQLMERFYTHLRAADSLTQALQETKIEMIRSGALSHPFYWAGFILSGKADARVFHRLNARTAVGAAALLMLGGLAILAWLRLKRRPRSLR